MRLRGTGNAPDGQYVKGQIVDADEQTAASLLDRGWVEEVPPEEDPGRASEFGIAQAIVRGDTFAHPDDAAVAEGFQGAGANPEEGKDPYAVLDGEEGVSRSSSAQSGIGAEKDEDLTKDKKASGSTSRGGAK